MHGMLKAKVMGEWGLLPHETLNHTLQARCMADMHITAYTPCAGLLMALLTERCLFINFPFYH